MDDFDYVCPSCSHMMTLPLSFHGKEGACPRCDNHDAWTATTVPIDDPLDLQLDPLEDNYDGQTVLSGVGAEDSGLFTFVFMCPFCTHEIALPRDVYGTKGKCSQCGKLCHTAVDLRRWTIFGNLKTGIRLIIVSTGALALLQLFLLAIVASFYRSNPALSLFTFQKLELIWFIGTVIALLGYWAGYGFTLYEWNLNLSATWLGQLRTDQDYRDMSKIGRWWYGNYNSPIKSTLHFSLLSILMIILAIFCLGGPLINGTALVVLVFFVCGTASRGLLSSFFCMAMFCSPIIYLFPGFSDEPDFAYLFKGLWVFGISGLFFHFRILLKRHQELKIFCTTKTLAGTGTGWELNDSKLHY